MTDGPSATLMVPTPAPRLGSRRPSGTKVGSRVPALAIATSGEGSPAAPATPTAATPKRAPSAEAVTPIAAAESKVPSAAAPSTAATTPKAKKEAATPTKKEAAAPVSLLKADTLKVSGANTPAGNTPRGGRSRSGSQMSTGSRKLKSLSVSSPKFSGSISATPLMYRARAGAQGDDSVPAAGVPYKSKYAVPRSNTRSVPGKSQAVTDTLCIYPDTTGKSASPVRAKRVMAAAYSPTAVSYSDAESRQFQAEQRLGGKRCASPRSLLAPWERDHPADGSPKRAGSCKPLSPNSITAPWAKEDDGFSHNRKTRSHTAAAAMRSVGSPFGVTEGSHDAAFKKGDEKVIQSAKPFGARPTTGKCVKSSPSDHDILNPDAPMEKSSPSGRRAFVVAPSEEYVRPLSIKQVEQVEHVDRATGKRGNLMATAACEGSPFRTERDDARQSALSPERSAMGIQSHSPAKQSLKVMCEGRSGGVQSYHIDPTNDAAINSKFSPPRERAPPAKRGKSNIESLPGTDRDSLKTVDPVRAAYHKDTLVGVMYAAPQRTMPAYEVVAPFWTADASN